jgi:hypothetical protein
MLNHGRGKRGALQPGRGKQQTADKQGAASKAVGRAPPTPRVNRARAPDKVVDRALIRERRRGGKALRLAAGQEILVAGGRAAGDEGAAAPRGGAAGGGG